MNAHAASSGTGSRILDDLAEVIGEEAAFALAAEFMGEIVYIPKDPATEPRIAAVVGEEKAAQFCEAFWRTYIPFPSRVVIERLVIQLAEQSDPPMTKRAIAQHLKIRQAKVFAILKRHREAKAAKGQSSLF
jgi:hypothetical protein